MDPNQTITIDITTRPATLDDVEAVVDVFNACSLAIVGRAEYSVQEISQDWQSPGFDLAADTQVVLTPEGRLIGYGDLWGSSASFVRFTSWVRVHPDYLGLGIGTYLNQWVEARARREMHQAPEGTRVVLTTYAAVKDEAARELLQGSGMLPARYAWQMEIELNEPPPVPQWPEGIALRAKSPGEERDFYAARRAAFKDHWGYIEEPFEEGLERWRHFYETDPNYDPSLWFLAEAGGQIAGFSLSTPQTIEDPDMGWVHLLGVLPDWRRRGLGLALLQHALGELYRRGVKRAGLSVDAQNLTGATRLYEKAGMHVVEEYVQYEKELRPGKELRTQSI